MRLLQCPCRALLIFISAELHNLSWQAISSTIYFANPKAAILHPQQQRQPIYTLSSDFLADGLEFLRSNDSLSFPIRQSLWNIINSLTSANIEVFFSGVQSLFTLAYIGKHNINMIPWSQVHSIGILIQLSNLSPGCYPYLLDCCYLSNAQEHSMNCTNNVRFLLHVLLGQC